MGLDQIPKDSSGTPLPAHLEGYLLVSETELIDPNFYRTVVLMISHGEDGAFGLVLNRPSNTTLAEIIPEYAHRRPGHLVPFVGGPVEQHYLFTLHSGLPGESQSEFAHAPADGILFEPAFEIIDRYFTQADADQQSVLINFYVGYSGWAPGQLEEEIAAGAWLVIPATPAIVFHPDPTEGWNAALRQKGGLYGVIAQTGFKPSVN